MYLALKRFVWSHVYVICLCRSLSAAKSRVICSCCCTMQHSSRQSSLEEISMKREQLSQKEELIECLQEELVKVRLREAENDALIRDLRARIQELEEV